MSSPLQRPRALFGIETLIVLAPVVLGAGLWPAERAARIQPTEALRH